MPNAPVFSSYALFELRLNEAAEFQALLKKYGLAQTKSDVSVGIIGFEALIKRLVVPFAGDECVLLHGNPQAFFASVHPHHKGAGSDCIGAGEGVAVDAHEEIGFDAVGELNALSNFRVGISIPCHDNFHIRKTFGDIVAQEQCHIQRHRLFGGFVPAGSQIPRIRSAMPCINDQNHAWSNRSKRSGKDYKRPHGKQDRSFH